jgi:hypothetical protein
LLRTAAAGKWAKMIVRDLLRIKMMDEMKC